MFIDEKIHYLDIYRLNEACCEAHKKVGGRLPGWSTAYSVCPVTTCAYLVWTSLWACLCAVSACRYLPLHLYTAHRIATLHAAVGCLPSVSITCPSVVHRRSPTANCSFNCIVAPQDLLAHPSLEDIVHYDAWARK
jgi:hypothetical protein